MVEVFKTNVTDQSDAKRLVEQIHLVLSNCKANFDLEDCDNILRVQFITGRIDPSAVIALLKCLGYHAEVLPDELPVLSDTVICRKTFLNSEKW